MCLEFWLNQKSSPSPSHLLLYASQWDPHRQVPSVHLLCSSVKSGFIRPKHRFPLWCPFVVFHGPSSSLLLLGLPQWWFLCSSLAMKAWLTQSPPSSWCWEVSAAWTLRTLWSRSQELVNWWFLRLVTVTNFSCAAGGTLAFHGSHFHQSLCFCDCAWRYIQSSWNLKKRWTVVLRQIGDIQLHNKQATTLHLKYVCTFT